jgi:hypothetical protein
LLVGDYIGGVEGGEDSDLVEGIFLFFIGKIIHFHLFEGVDLGIDYSLHFVDAGVGALSQFSNDYEVLHRHVPVRYYIFIILP